MKYPASIYARAFLDGTHDSKKFLSVIAKNGDMPGIKKIYNAVEELVTHRGGGRVVTLELAREVPKSQRTQLEKKFIAKDSVHIKTNPALVAGVRVTLDGEQELDQSLQRKLNKLFHHGV